MEVTEEQKGEIEKEAKKLYETNKYRSYKECFIDGYYSAATLYQSRINSLQEKNDLLVEALDVFAENPYPEDIFLPVSNSDLKNIHELLQKEMNMPLDRLTGHIGRLLGSPLIEKAKQVLSTVKK